MRAEAPVPIGSPLGIPSPWPDAGTSVLGVIGWPVAHSLSPAMHNRGFQERGWNAVYLAFPVPPEQLPAAIAALPALGLAGLNVTVPHKEGVARRLDRLDPEAAAAGAVNTVARVEGEWVGFNTDGRGWLASLAEAGHEVAGREVLLFGAGGAARGLGVALLGAGVRRLTVVNRSPARAEALLRALAAWSPEARIEAIPLADRERVAAAIGRAEVAVNATALGMAGHEEGGSPWSDWSGARAGLLVADLIYVPRVTPYLEAARRAGLATLGGLGMLVHQAALAWEHWFGERGPVDTFRAAAEEALRRRGSP